MPELLALIASVVWGTSDFAGGTLARRMPSTRVVFLGVAIACGALLLGWPFVHPPLGGYQVYGAGAGLCGAVALVSFYRAMAAGPMSVVAPMSATGTVIPVLWALFHGEAVGPAQGAGMALAFGGVLLACGPRLRGAPRPARTTLLYTLVAGAGFGWYFVLFALGSKHSVYGTLLAQRFAGLFALAPLALGRPRVTTEPELGTAPGAARAIRIGPSLIATLLLVGLGDMTANGLYGLAAHRAGTDLAVVTVLASLYPVATTLLARFVQGERLRAVQNIGVAAALGGVLLLNA